MLDNQRLLLLRSLAGIILPLFAMQCGESPI
jgi:hypothetical protein